MDTTETDRITISLPGELADYAKRQAAAEMRTVSNMVAFMVEEYRRSHEPSALSATMPHSAPNR